MRVWVQVVYSEAASAPQALCLDSCGLADPKTNPLGTRSMYWFLPFLSLSSRPLPPSSPSLSSPTAFSLFLQLFIINKHWKVYYT